MYGKEDDRRLAHRTATTRPETATQQDSRSRPVQTHDTNYLRSVEFLYRFIVLLQEDDPPTQRRFDAPTRRALVIQLFTVGEDCANAWMAVACSVELGSHCVCSDDRWRHSVDGAECRHQAAVVWGTPCGDREVRGRLRWRRSRGMNLLSRICVPPDLEQA